MAGPQPPPPLQRNAADREQVKYARRVERRAQERVTASLQVVMQTAEGRLVLWELLERAGIYRSIWDPSARIHYNAGRQDYGHEILGLMLEADADLYLEAEREARDRKRRQARETEAVQTPTATG